MSFFDDIDNLDGPQEPAKKAERASDKERFLPALPDPVEEPVKESPQESPAQETSPFQEEPFEEATPLEAPEKDFEDAVLVEPSTSPAAQKLSSVHSSAPKSLSKKKIIYGIILLLVGILVAIAAGGGSKKKNTTQPTVLTYAPATAVDPTAIYGTTSTDPQATNPEGTTPPQVITTSPSSTTQASPPVTDERAKGMSYLDEIQKAVTKGAAAHTLPKDTQALASYLSRQVKVEVTDKVTKKENTVTISMIGTSTISASYQGHGNVSVMRLIPIPQ